MKIIHSDDLFWTGDRWSLHIAEAKRFTEKKAIVEMRYIRGLGFDCHWMIAPNLQEWNPQ